MSLNAEEGPVYDPGLCRCCGALKKCRLLNHEYDWMGQNEIYSDMFRDCFGLLLSHLDGEPLMRLVCTTCVSRLREANMFRQQVLRCEEQLLQMCILRGVRGQVPVAEDSLDTTVGFKINVNDFDHAKPCNLADKMFVIEESILEVPVAEDSLDITVGFKINVNDLENAKFCNDNMFVIEESIVEVPAAEDSLNTTVGFKINVNDVEDAKPCNLADNIFVIDESIPEVPVAEDSLDTTVGFKINVNDFEDAKPCNLADNIFVIEESNSEDPSEDFMPSKKKPKKTPKNEKTLKTRIKRKKKKRESSEDEKDREEVFENVARMSKRLRSMKESGPSEDFMPPKKKPKKTPKNEKTLKTRIKRKKKRRESSEDDKDREVFENVARMSERLRGVQESALDMYLFGTQLRQHWSRVSSYLYCESHHTRN